MVISPIPALDNEVDDDAADATDVDIGGNSDGTFAGRVGPVLECWRRRDLVRDDDDDDDDVGDDDDDDDVKSNHCSVHFKLLIDLEATSS